MPVTVRERAAEEQNIQNGAPEKTKRKPRKFLIFVCAYAAAVIILNILARITAFADFYTDNIFGLWPSSYGRLTGLFPFSVGEVLIALAAVLLLAAVILLIFLIFLRRKEKLRKFVFGYLKFILVTVITVVLIMTLNCNIPYSCSKLNVNGNRDKEYSVEQIQTLRQYVVEQCNELSQKMQRDENEIIVFDGDADEEVRAALRGLSDEYPRFAGYYPQPKGLIGSYFMYQSNVIGVYFPFTMEANYSTYLSSAYYPSTTAHELSHLKGYLFENEANFFAFLACTHSECDYVRYSGYLGVLYYIDNDYYACVSDETYAQQVQISQLVRFDNRCYDSETVKKLEEKKPVIDDKVMENINETITDTYMHYYNATPNYSEVTLLILQYYDGVLY